MMRRLLGRLLVGLSILAPLAGGPAATAAEPGRGLDIYWIDVMGGAATLVVTPEGQSILFDSGWPGLNDRDPLRIVHVLKEQAGCERLDHLVTTHWHIDHFGGIEGIARRVKIGRFWDRGLPEDNLPGLDFPDGPKPDDPLGVAYRKASAGKRSVLRPGDTMPLGETVALRVLAAGGKVVGGEGAANAVCASAPADLPIDGSDNARSLVVHLKYGDFDFFDAGDLTWNIEKQLVCPVDRIGPIDVYQVTHHGMDISNHPSVVQTIRPTVAIMNNGPRKGGSPATVRLLKATPSIQALYALHRNQATGPNDNADPALTANDTPEGGQFIHLHVAPGGKTYTVRIGATGKERTFSSK